MRINAKLWSVFTLLPALMFICQSFSERENSYVAKRYLKRKIFYPISSDLEALGLGIYQANFVNSTHQTSQALVIQDFRCLRKSNFRQSRSLIFPSYPIARVRWCYTRSELITVCNFHSGSMVLSLDWKLWIWIWLWIGICVKAAESLRNSFSQLIFIL